MGQKCLFLHCIVLYKAKTHLYFVVMSVSSDPKNFHPIIISFKIMSNRFKSVEEERAFRRALVMTLHNKKENRNADNYHRMMSDGSNKKKSASAKTNPLPTGTIVETVSRTLLDDEDDVDNNSAYDDDEGELEALSDSSESEDSSRYLDEARSDYDDSSSDDSSSDDSSDDEITNEDAAPGKNNDNMMMMNNHTETNPQPFFDTLLEPGGEYFMPVRRKTDEERKKDFKELCNFKVNEEMTCRGRAPPPPRQPQQKRAGAAGGVNKVFKKERSDGKKKAKAAFNSIVNLAEVQQILKNAECSLQLTPNSTPTIVVSVNVQYDDTHAAEEIARLQSELRELKRKQHFFETNKRRMNEKCDKLEKEKLELASKLDELRSTTFKAKLQKEEELLVKRRQVIEDTVTSMRKLFTNETAELFLPSSSPTAADASPRRNNTNNSNVRFTPFGNCLTAQTNCKNCGQVVVAQVSESGSRRSRLDPLIMPWTSLEQLKNSLVARPGSADMGNINAARTKLDEIIALWKRAVQWPQGEALDIEESDELKVVLSELVKKKIISYSEAGTMLSRSFHKETQLHMLAETARAKIARKKLPPDQRLDDGMKHLRDFCLDVIEMRREGKIDRRITVSYIHSMLRDMSEEQKRFYPHTSIKSIQRACRYANIGCRARKVILKFTDHAKEMRVRMCAELEKRSTFENFCFSDETAVRQHQRVGYEMMSLTNRLSTASKAQVSPMFMVWAAINEKIGVVCFHFFDQGEKIDGRKYAEILREKFLPRAEEYYNAHENDTNPETRKLILQEDNATPHFTHHAHKLFADNECLQGLTWRDEKAQEEMLDRLEKAGDTQLPADFMNCYGVITNCYGVISAVRW